MHVLTCHGSYIINLITTLSVSAISSNGTVRGGGAYYLISRSLGPEFGGSIGLVFYLGFVFNTGMNAVGLIDCIVNNFGETSGTMFQVVPESFVSPPTPPSRRSRAVIHYAVASVSLCYGGSGILHGSLPRRIGHIFSGFKSLACNTLGGHLFNPDFVAAGRPFSESSHRSRLHRPIDEDIEG